MPAILKEKSDEELLIYYRQVGDQLAMGELFKRHSLLCFAVCNKYLKNEDAAQDAVMQIFENLFEDLKKHQVINFRTWLHSVARNHCLMLLRKPVLFQSILEHDEEKEDSFMEKEAFLHQEDRQEDKEHKLQLMETFLLSLNEKQKICLQLFYLRQLSYEEICQQTGCDINEVKSAIQNGKRNLKNRLAEKGITHLFIWAIWIQQSA